MSASHAAKSGMPIFLLSLSSWLHVTQKNADILPIKVSFPVTPVLDFIAQRWTLCKYEQILCYGQSLRKYVQYNYEKESRLGSILIIKDILEETF